MARPIVPEQSSTFLVAWPLPPSAPRVADANPPSLGKRAKAGCSSQ